MFPSQLDFLKHIVDECKFVLNATNNKTQEQVFSDEMVCRALIRSIEIIGEASKRIDPEFKSLHPHIEWKKMAGTRDVLIHNYFGVD